MELSFVYKQICASSAPCGIHVLDLIRQLIIAHLHGAGALSHGVGYNLIMNDYTLVEISIYRVRVFTLSSNSWRTISSNGKYPVNSREPGKFIDEVPNASFSANYGSAITYVESSVSVNPVKKTLTSGDESRSARIHLGISCTSRRADLSVPSKNLIFNWFITTILVIEGAQIFSRSHELEWQHMANWSLANAGINEFSTLKLCSHC
ncbi:hypothetical protein Sjap_004842 [Stephania japonica]|uniref:Uncharacterized protein n=1 Tax=Stephania japonica TaxID=461633 RepID=A0AAP0PJG9_9MAGN